VSGITMLKVESSAFRTVEKLGYTIGALRPCVTKKRGLLFDVAQVAQVWAQLIAGDYDEQLATWRSYKGGEAE